MARGTDENANPRRVAIFRTIEGQRMAAAFDLVSIRRGQMEDPRIYSGDIVVVDGSKIKAPCSARSLSAIPLADQCSIRSSHSSYSARLLSRADLLISASRGGKVSRKQGFLQQMNTRTSSPLARGPVWPLAAQPGRTSRCRQDWGQQHLWRVQAARAQHRHDLADRHGVALADPRQPSPWRSRRRSSSLC